MKEMESNFDKIQDLLISGQKENILLAFELGKAQGFSEAEILAPWEEVFMWANERGKKVYDSYNINELKSLAIAFKTVENIPRAISGLTNLESLAIIESLTGPIAPNTIDQLFNLKDLTIEDNEISELPRQLGNLTKLVEAYFNNNKLASLPQSIGDLKALEKLELKHNELELLPKSIGNLSSLKELYLTSNQLTSLPESIGQLENLELLILAENQLTSLPKTIANLQKLRFLELEGNPILGEELQVIIDQLPNCNVTFSRGFEKEGTTQNVQDEILILLQSNDPEKHQAAWKMDQEQNSNFIKNGFEKEFAPLMELFGLEIEALLTRDTLEIKGIEMEELTILALPCLKHLHISESQIEQLNVTHLEQLSILECSNNRIEQLNLEDLPKLSVLDCSNNALESFSYDLPALVELNCSNNKIELIELDSSEFLSSLDCSRNQLSELSCSSFSLLRTLICTDNPFKEIYSVVPYKFKKLEHDAAVQIWNNTLSGSNTQRRVMNLVCSDLPEEQAEGWRLDALENRNRLRTGLQQKLEALLMYTQLPIEQLMHVEELEIDSSEAFMFTISYLPRLKVIKLKNMTIERLEISHLPNLEQVSADGENSSIRMLILDDLSKKVQIDYQMFLVKNLILRNLAQISELHLEKLNLESLDLDNLINLEVLECGTMGSLILIHLPQLKELDCSNKSLSTFRAYHLEQLESIDCSNNNLKDEGFLLNNLAQLTRLKCKGNQLAELDLLAVPQLTNIEM